MYRRLSFAATVSGVILQLAGLALDAALHARDATLAAREGPFTLTNPGHLLFFVGLALTVLGVGTTLLVLVLRGANGVAPAAPGAGRDWRMTTASMAALSVVAVLALASGALALDGGVFTGHAHGGGRSITRQTAPASITRKVGTQTRSTSAGSSCARPTACSQR